ncbi:unnamed protein product, partial [Rotaria magnacalcarata]
MISRFSSESNNGYGTCGILGSITLY